MAETKRGWIKAGAVLGSVPGLWAARQFAKRGIVHMNVGEIIATTGALGLAATGAVTGAAVGATATAAVAIHKAAKDRARARREAGLPPLTETCIQALRDACAKLTGDRRAKAEAATDKAEEQWGLLGQAYARMSAADPRTIGKAADLRATVQRAALAAVAATETAWRVITGRSMSDTAEAARNMLARGLKGRTWTEQQGTDSSAAASAAAKVCDDAAAWEQGRMSPKPRRGAASPQAPARRPTSPELDAACRWWHGQGFAPVPKPGAARIELDDDAAVLDTGSRMDIVAAGELSDEAIRLMCLRGKEWGGLTLNEAWSQGEVDRFHVHAARIGLPLAFDGFKPSPSAVEEVGNAADAKATMRADVRDGERLLAYLAGQHIDSDQLRAFCNVHGDDVHADIAAMLPLQLAAAARVARVEGQRLIEERGPDVAATIERVRDVGQANKQAGDEPVKYIPGNNGG